MLKCKVQSYFKPVFFSGRYSISITNLGNQILPAFQFLVEKPPTCLIRIIKPIRLQELKKQVTILTVHKNSNM